MALGGTACKKDEDPPPPGDDDASDDDDDTGDDDTMLPWDDADGDGRPDERDRCPDSDPGVLVDSRGCSAKQAAGCDVSLVSPEDGASISGDSVAFEFDGDCEGFRVYTSTDPTFPIHASHLVGWSPSPGSMEADVADLPIESGQPLYWSVEASALGHSFRSEVRSLEVTR